MGRSRVHCRYEQEQQPWGRRGNSGLVEEGGDGGRGLGILVVDQDGQGQVEESEADGIEGNVQVER